MHVHRMRGRRIIDDDEPDVFGVFRVVYVILIWKIYLPFAYVSEDGIIEICKECAVIFEPEEGSTRV